MAEYDIVIPIDGVKVMSETVREVGALQFESTSELVSSMEIMNFDLQIEEQHTITPTRIPKTYTSYRILPVFTRFVDDNSDEEVVFKKETREFDMVLFGMDGNKTPRRTPTELIYRAKKLKNPFPTE